MALSTSPTSRLLTCRRLTSISLLRAIRNTQADKVGDTREQTDRPCHQVCLSTAWLCTRLRLVLVGDTFAVSGAAGNDPVAMRRQPAPHRQYEGDQQRARH